MRLAPHLTPSLLCFQVVQLEYLQTVVSLNPLDSLREMTNLNRFDILTALAYLL